MKIRLSRMATGVCVIAAMALMSGVCWAIYYDLGPSKDEWGLKYDVAVSEADGDKLNVTFTLTDAGRLKPTYSIELIALSKQIDSQGGRTYDRKAPFELKTTKEGKQVGQVQITKDIADRAKIRILTQNVDGKRYSSASYYDIPLQKHLNKGSATDTPVASPPSKKVAR